MKRSLWLATTGALALATLFVPSASASGTAQPDSPPTTAPMDTLSASFDLQRSAVNGQVTLGRGSMALNATLTDIGPEGQLSLGVPGQFAVTTTLSNGSVGSTICGVVGRQEVTLSGAQGAGLHVELQNANANPVACAPLTTADAGLTMAPLIVAAQDAPPSDDGVLRSGVADALRRALFLAIVSGLMFAFRPGLLTPLKVTARATPWSRLGLGLCLLVSLPVIGVLVFIMGLPVGLWWVGLLILAFYVTLLVLSLAVAGLVVGAWLLGRIHAPRLPTALVLAAGLLIIAILGFLPTIGSFVNVVALMYGAGGLMLLPRTRESVAASAAPVADGAQIAPVPDGEVTVTRTA